MHYFSVIYIQWDCILFCNFATLKIKQTYMELIKDKEFGGERPLYGSHDIRMENVTVHAGESALKECSNVEAYGCRFEGKYPFWHVDGFRISNCHFTEGARAALWYSKGLEMENCTVEAPKMFRDMEELRIIGVTLLDAAETLWHCRDIELKDVKAYNADYIMMHCENIRIDNLVLNGNYSFQYTKNVEIHNSVLNTKDAFWETDNVTVYDSVIKGEYLGWHSRNLRLVNCHISGTQPLCYAENLVMENCTMGDDADLAFEYSSVQAGIKGNVVSVKNPLTGRIAAAGYGEVILDENLKSPGDCEIVTVQG